MSTVGVKSGLLEGSAVAVGRGVPPAAQPETATAANPATTTPRRMPDSNLLSSWLAPVAADMAATGN